MMRANYFPLAVGAMAALSVLGSRPAAAATYNVAAAALPATIASASNGDTINVFAGTCSSHVTVNKSLTIRGAQADVPGYAGTRGGSETLLENGVTVTASNVTLNGLIISGGDLVGDVNGCGILLNKACSAVVFSNNIVRDNTFGLYLNGTGHTVQYNYFFSNNRRGSASGDGIYSDFGLSNTDISHNVFEANQEGSIVIMGGVKGAVVDTISIADNEVMEDATLAVYGSTNVTITRNHLCNTEGGHALLLGGGNNHVSVSENQILGSGFRGVRVSVGAKYTANKDIRLYNNDIIGNAAGGLSVVTGAYVDSGTLTQDRTADGDVDAECNSWGAANGPAPGGSGDKVSGAADVTPFRKYIPLTNQVGAQLLQTYSSVATRTYLQVVRLTNYGCKPVVGGAYYTFDNLAPNGVQLANATGTQDDACQLPTGSPWFTFVTNGNRLLQGQSVIVTLKFTTNVGITFNTTKIGGTDGSGPNVVGRRILATSFR